jgi:hypothetical protein
MHGRAKRCRIAGAEGAPCRPDRSADSPRSSQRSVGYSRLIGIDEEGTLERFKAIRSNLVDAKIAEHRGRIVKNTGDGS